MAHPIKPLLGFDETISANTQIGLPFRFKDYVQFVDWIGRAVRDDKRGAINDKIPDILIRLCASNSNWFEHTTQFEKHHRKKRTA